MFHTIVSIKNDGHYFCRAGGNRPDGLNEPVTMNVGLNAEIRDNLRFGLEFEKSAFGKYNVDNAVNASFRYSF
ncbi:autotransporter outer membrane beta-barrel domain-containing protein [Salmonella enterica subsp. enterica serovar Kentucky]|nr:autotransporter outer membrane beta-barrel domain-containing protein [Salmonella enterica subsp. enterica serovar Kentucky]ECG2660334.1 autotransporter outer membrane beta-barrel domain-containing protein [Salmonella enterica subsp. enterica serovar Kentucky]